MKVLIRTSRNWNDYTAIGLAMEQLPKDTEVIHCGTSPGDAFAGLFAEAHELAVSEVEAFFVTDGNQAVSRQNDRALATKPDLILVFCNDLSKSPDTSDLVKKAQDAGIQISAYTSRPKLEDI